MKDYYKIINEKTNYILLKFIDYESNQNLFKCKNCNKKFNASIHYVLRKKKNVCPYCEITSKNATKDQLQFKMNQIDSDYQIIEYGNSVHSKTKILHKKCNRIYESTISSFLSGNHRCPYCQHRSFKYTNEEVDEIIKNIDSNYTRISDYESYDKPFLMKHSCGHIWKVTLHNFLVNGSRCPNCWKILNRSKGEEFIKKILNSKNIQYETEKSFTGCRNKRILKFDFYIPTLNLCIEFDGKQHFFSYDHFGGNAKLEQCRENDFIKNNFCKKNKINLLRLKYNLSRNKIKEIINIILDSNCSTANHDKHAYFTDKSYMYYYHKTI